MGEMFHRVDGRDNGEEASCYRTGLTLVKDTWVGKVLLVLETKLPFTKAQSLCLWTSSCSAIGKVTLRVPWGKCRGLRELSILMALQQQDLRGAFSLLPWGKNF